MAPARNPEPDVAPARVLAPHTDPLPFPTEVAASAAPAEPRYLATADPSNLDELLDARSPLLARAFAAAGSGSEHHVRASSSPPQPAIAGLRVDAVRQRVARVVLRIRRRSLLR